MKKIFISFIAILTMMVSCTDEFLTKDPLGVESTETYYKDPTNCRLALNSVYDPFALLELYGRNMMVFDWMSDETEKGGSSSKFNAKDGDPYALDQGELYRIVLGNANPSLAKEGGFYTALYRVITRASALIDNADKTNSLIKQYVAEARFLRSLAYLDLVRIYGPVPLIKEVISPEIAKEVGNRAAGDDAAGTKQVAEIYAFVISELDAIKGELPEVYGATDFGRVTSVAVKAYLAKAYLYSGDFQKSYEVSKDLINSTTVNGLEPVYHNIFNFEAENENSEEVVFTLKMTASTKYNHEGDGSTKAIDTRPRIVKYNGEVVSIRNIAYGLHQPTASLVSKFAVGDPRLDMIARAGVDTLYLPLNTASPYSTSETDPAMWLQIGKHAENTGNYCLKGYLSHDVMLASSANIQATGKDIILMRWAEVLLNGAEAAYRSGHTADALTWVNLVRERARNSKRTVNAINMKDCQYTAGTVPAALGSITITDIKNERQYELYSENGTRYFDLVRWNSTNDGDGIDANTVLGALKTDMVGNVRNWNPARLGRLPISNTQILLHSGGNLKQNPGY